MFPSSSTRTELDASRTRERAGAGFTLLEVLVALVVIGLVLLASLRGAAALTTSARDARIKLLAVLTAENRLHELRLGGPQLPVGVNRQDCEQGGFQFVCEQSIQPTPNPFFRRVQVRVLNSDSGSEREYALLMSVLPSASN
jgi:general secretion pathway protein I